MNFEIIKATIKNAPEMGYIHACSWQKAYHNIIPESIINTFTAEQRTQVFEQALKTRTEEYYLFQVDDLPAGIALLYKSHEDMSASDEGEIYAIYFHPDYWGTPATQLGFQFCIERLKELGYRQIHIWVLEENLRARKFYEKNGFTFDGKTQEIIIGKPLLEIRYSMDVNTAI